MTVSTWPQRPGTSREPLSPASESACGFSGFGFGIISNVGVDVEVAGKGRTSTGFVNLVSPPYYSLSPPK